MKIHLLKKVFKLGEIIVESGLKNESFLRSTNSIDVIQQEEIRDSGADHFQEIVDRISISIGQEVQADQDIFKFGV